MTHKLKSRKVWIVIWAIALISYIVITSKADFIPLATLLATIPLTYLGVNAYTKKIEETKNG